MIEYGLLEIFLMASIAFILTYTLTPKVISDFEKWGRVVPDINKKVTTMVARPVSMPMLVGFAVAQGALFFMLDNMAVNVILTISFVAWWIGYSDDMKTKPGWFKPVALVSCSAIIFVFGAYHNSLIFPVIGLVELPHYLYLALLIPMIPIFANTVNSIDVVNGAVSGVMTVAGFALAIVLGLSGEYQLMFIAMPLAFISFAFWQYHKIPSKAFMGDSGTLMLGAIYGGLAIMGNVEVFAVIIIAPLILNSVLFLASVRRIVEHRQITKKPVVSDEEMRICDSGIKGAPWTLVRLLVRGGPMTEKSIANWIIGLTFICSVISIGLVMLT